MVARSWSCLVLLAWGTPVLAQRLVVINQEPHHDSTIDGNYMRTYGRMLEGLGLGAKHYAEGVRTITEARALAQQVAFDRVQLKRRLQDEWNQRRVANPRMPVVIETLRQQARAAAPQRLDDTQLTEYGEIRWNDVLLEDELEDQRQKLEAFFASRSQGSVDRARQACAFEACDQMLVQLQARVRELPAVAYLQARKFIDSLKHEAWLAD